MAIVRAVKSGNWSDVTVWNTGALPTSADDVYSNTFTVTIDVSPTVLSISNASTTGVTAGGGFAISANGITLNANVTVVSSGTNVLTISVGSGATATVIGNAQGGLNNGAAIVFSGAGALNVTGNCIGGGGGAGNSFGVSVTGSGTLTVVGNATGGTSQSGVSHGGTGIVNITGNCTGGSGSNASGAAIISTGTLNITGTCTGGSVGSGARHNNSTGTLNITGTCIGGSGSTAYGANNDSTGTMVHIGTVQASNAAPGIGLGASSSQVTILSGPFLTNNTGINPVVALRWHWANSGTSPTYLEIRNANLTLTRPLYTLDSFTGNTPATANVRSGTTYGPNNLLTGTLAVPPAGSVALGVPVDNTTGTAVLTQANFQAALTAQGLTSARAANLDNLDTTVSSRLASASYQAPLDASGTRTAIGLASANLDTQLAPLPNLDTTVSSRLASASYQAPLDASGTRAAVGLATANLDTQLAPLPNLDTTVSSRLASASYQAPLDASGTRTAIGLASANLDTQFTSIPANVRTNLTTELGRIDATVSSRSTFDPALDVVAHVTLVDTTTDLTNPPVVPTPEQIATAVRTELSPELDLIDVATSTRLAAADYQQPPTPEQNAEAVRTELAPELDRLSNCATVDTTGQQIQNALSI